MLERAETISEAAATVVLGSAARDARDAGISLDDLDRAMQDRCPEEYRQALDA